MQLRSTNAVRISAKLKYLLANPSTWHFQIAAGERWMWLGSVMAFVKWPSRCTVEKCILSPAKLPIRHMVWKARRFFLFQGADSMRVCSDMQNQQEMLKYILMNVV